MESVRICFIRGSSGCIACDPGKGSAVVGAQSGDTCVDCTVGKLAPMSGTEICGDCPAGLFAEDAGAVECDSCRPGRWSASGAPSCIDCTAGQFDAGNGSAPSIATCIDCLAGLYNPARGRTSCVGCPTGRWSDTVGAVALDTCEPCPRHTLYTGTGASTVSNCTDCEYGQFSTEGQDHCIACQLEFMYNNEFERCQECPYPNRCSDGHCVPGTRGEGCASCDFGFFQAGKMCMPCPEDTPLLVVFIGVALSCGFIVAIWELSHVEHRDVPEHLRDPESEAEASELEGNADTVTESVEALKGLASTATTMSQFATVLGISLPHLQLLGFLAELPLKWPPFVKRFGRWIVTLVSFDFGQLYSPECQLSADSEAAQICKCHCSLCRTKTSLYLYEPVLFRQISSNSLLRTESSLGSTSYCAFQCS